MAQQRHDREIDATVWLGKSRTSEDLLGPSSAQGEAFEALALCMEPCGLLEAFLLFSV